MDGAHGVGAGQRRQRRTVVQFDGQGVCAGNADGGLDEGAGQQGRGGRGWAKSRTVRGAVGRLSGRAGIGVAVGQLPGATDQTGGDTERRWQDAAAGYSGSQGPHRADGVEAGDRTDLRGGVPSEQLRLSAGAALSRRTQRGRRSDQGGLCLRGRRRPRERLRQPPARAADGAGRATDQRWSRARSHPRLARPGHRVGQGAMDANRGHAAPSRASGVR